MDHDETGTVLGQMPKHRARRRSPLRAQRPDPTPARGATPDPFGGPKPVDAQAATALIEGMRAVAEVAELALTATALMLREIESKLPPVKPRAELPGADSGRPTPRD